MVINPAARKIDESKDAHEVQLWIMHLEIKLHLGILKKKIVYKPVNDK